MKNFLNKLWLVLMAAGVASAADVAPLVFDSLATYYNELSDVSDPKTMDDAIKAEHQKYWNKLMTFKMWGTFGISMGHASAPDVNGAIGTAHGNMELTNGDHKLGGPIYIGGEIVFQDGPDVFLSGPARVKGDFNSGANGNSFYGTHCIEGVASTKNQNSTIQAEFKNDKDPVGRLAQGAAAKLGMCSYDSVPEVPTYLTIPDVPALPASANVIYSDITINNGQTYNIDVPPNSNGSNIYDVYVGGNIIMGANSSIVVRMANNKNLVRLFISGTIVANSSSTIQVAYVDEGAQYLGDSWVNVTNSTFVANKDYAGNVLFHCKEGIDWSAMNGGSFFQGSFLSKKKIKVGPNLVLAGQLLANELEIGHEFDGSSFRYVPFDPPVLNTAEGVKTYLVEGHKQDTVKIALDKEATTLIDFEYCFDFGGTVDGKDPNGLATRADIATADIPLFDGTKCVNPGKAYFDIDSKNLRDPIILTAFDDKIDEGTDSKPGRETFRIIIQNLNAATLKDGSHDGFITLEISDPDLDPLKFKKDTLHTINENPRNDAVIDTLRGVHGIVGCPACVYSISDTSHYIDYVTVTDSGYVLVKDSTIFDFEKIQYIDIQVHVEDVDNKMKADTTIIIPIGNVNENPILEEQNFEIDEHLPKQTVVGTLVWGESDSVSVFRQDIFTAVGGDTAFFSVSSTGVITTKKEFDYETEPDSYTIQVKLVDKNDSTLYVIKPVTINIRNVNENPKITTEFINVTENSPKGTVVDTLKAIDYDLDDTVLTWTLISDQSKCFDLSTDGVVTLKCSDIDYEKTPTISIRVKVEDQHGGSDTKVIRVNVIDIPGPTVEITEASNEDSTWAPPKNPIYTNKDSLNVCWEVNHKNKTCADTNLVPGYNKICKEACDIDGFEGCAEDCFIAYFSDVSPKVVVDAGGDANLASNIYTIVEQPAVGDTNVYVKDSVRNINVYITDYDPIMGETKDTLKFEKVDITKKVAVPQTTYDALSMVAKQTVSLDELNPNTTRTPINGTNVLNSYPTKIAGTEVTVSYVTDTKGNIVKQAVVNEKGKVDSIEVITVSYQTEINGQLVTISYQADATTGMALNVDGNGGFVSSKNSDSSTGIFKVSYEYLDRTSGQVLELTYVVDKKGNLVKNPEGDRGYQVSFTYTDKYGNVAEQSVFVVLDQTLPTVEILSPLDNQVSHANYVKVEWTVNGEKQDTLTTQGLVKGPNVIVRFYKDKAGNIASDTVRVFMKEGKDLEIAVERPVTVIDKDKVDEYYADNPPKKGQTFAVSVRNPTTKEEVETLIGGDFKTKEGSGEKPYANTKSSKHLGPTLILNVTLPTISDGKSGSVSGLATLDDLILPNGMISSAGIGVDTSKLDAAAKKDYKEYTVEEYVSEFCEDGTKIPSDFSQFNLYNSSLKLDIWVYTTLGNFVGKYSFTQELNDPSFANEAGVTQIFFEMKPDKDGYVHAKNGKLLATGAYLYKVDASLRNHLRCSVPPLGGTTTKTKGDVTKSSDELLKPFGYKRPANKK
ncbi:cadherin repeat domain-containing protein [Fibrobacter sp. UWOV1]|uniref:cadherin repeat domain-containing protein n=1 Tax=Fibrobacter sp. UWOV1 TaxID=1896215 RepID=UPI0009341E0E|nr:cadherin repeat domain-containing protein [Fibrobacter sp. UWOV1]